MKNFEKMRVYITLILCLVFSLNINAQDVPDVVDTLSNSAINLSVDLLDEEIDEVIFQTNTFLSDDGLIQGPFGKILDASIALAVLFALIMCAGMAYKMMLRKEPLDVMKLFRPFAVSLVLTFWYPPSLSGKGSSDGSILSVLAVVPNAFGAYTHELYQAEASVVQDSFDQVTYEMKQLEDKLNEKNAGIHVASSQVMSAIKDIISGQEISIDDTDEGQKQLTKAQIASFTAGILVFFDKLLMSLALIIYRIGWWGTIYCQQILLGMLTIFGPIQWAFCLLPKWEGAWAKWTIRYLTVHFYGAMLYFVGFYILLLFDIVLQLQYDDLHAITLSDETMQEFIKNSFMSTGYLMIASVVSLKCLDLVPDLAAWMIPEGETAFSTRQFGAGVAQQMQGKIQGVMPLGLGKMV